MSENIDLDRTMGEALLKIEDFMKFIDTVLEIYEEDSKLDNASQLTISNTLKIAFTLELCYKNMKQAGCLDMAQSAVLEHWKRKGRTAPEDISEFEEACDLILIACFRSLSLPLESLRTAVKEYGTLCGNERLKELVVYLVRDGMSCALLHSLAHTPPSVTTSVFLGWKIMLDCGQSEKVKSLILSCLLTKINVTSSILEIVNEASEEDADVSSLVVDVVISKMTDRSESGQAFCSQLVNTTATELVISVAKKFPSFLTALLGSFQLLAANAEWVCSLSPEGQIEYKWHNLSFPLNLLQELCLCEGYIGTRTQSWLARLHERPGCTVWEDISTCLEL